MFLTCPAGDAGVKVYLPFLPAAPVWRYFYVSCRRRRCEGRLAFPAGNACVEFFTFPAGDASVKVYLRVLPATPV